MSGVHWEWEHKATVAGSSIFIRGMTPKPDFSMSGVFFFTEQVHEAHESHVTAILVKAHLLLDDISSAQSVRLTPSFLSSVRDRYMSLLPAGP